LRMQVQAHIGRLSVTFYDEKSHRNAGGAHHDRRGGVRNLVGTGWWILSAGY